MKVAFLFMFGENNFGNIFNLKKVSELEENRSRHDLCS